MGGIIRPKGGETEQQKSSVPGGTISRNALGLRPEATSVSFQPKKRPATAGLMSTGKNSSCFLDVSGLGSLRALHDLKFDWVSFLKSAIAVSDDRGIMNENIRAIFAPDEAISFRVVEPLDSS